MTKILTMAEAIKQGYTHFVEEEGEQCTKFETLTADDIEYYSKYTCYIVDINKPKHFTIDALTIRDLIRDFLSEQDVMLDDEDNLGKIVDNHDFTGIAEQLNQKFKSHSYFEPLDIIVTF